MTKINLLISIMALVTVSACTTFPSCHASTIAESPSGLVCAFFGGSHEKNPDVSIYVSRKSGDKWSPPVEVANGIMNDTLRHPTWNPVLYQVPGGELLLFYKVGPNPSSWWGMMLRSADDGISWSKPEALPDAYIGPVKNKPVLLEDGTLICPTSPVSCFIRMGNCSSWLVH